MTQQHIDNDTLNRYIQTSMHSDGFMDSSQYHAVLDHLAACEECRQQVSVITQLHEGVQDIRQQSSLNENQHQLICDYIDGQLSSEEEQLAKKLIDNQPDAQRAALHYQSHTEEMKHHVAENTHSVVSPTASSAKSSVAPPAHNPLAWIGELFHFKSPMIYTMAVTAALFISVISLVQLPELNQKQTMIASYQDNPTLQFTEESRLPGIGFFTQSTNTSIPFNDINIQLLSENIIKISWPEIKGVELYKIRIQVFNQGSKTLLKEQETKDNHTTFQLAPQPDEKTTLQSDTDNNKRYEWVLYGNTIDDRMFYASGGFVVATVETDESSW